jgi:hypothetical protein
VYVDGGGLFRIATTYSLFHDERSPTLRTSGTQSTSSTTPVTIISELLIAVAGRPILMTGTMNASLNVAGVMLMDIGIPGTSEQNGWVSAAASYSQCITLSLIYVPPADTAFVAELRFWTAAGAVLTSDQASFRTVRL